MGYSYKGSISFGLIYIPINLQASIKNNDIGFNMIDRETMSRVQYKKTCVDCGDREVKQSDIVKGYEYEKDKYVIFEEADFEKLKTEKEKTINIERFVKGGQIDPIFYDKAYYVLPTGAEKAFALLIKAMQETDKVGIAKTVIGTKETLVAIRVKNGEMLLNTLYFSEEVQKNPLKEMNVQFAPKELDMAKDIVNAMSSDFNPEQYKDEYREKLQQAIESKMAGEEIVAPKEQKKNNIVNLMDALQKTLSKYRLETKQPKKKAVGV